MEFHIEQSADYRKSLKLGSERIGCYSKKQLKEKYPDKGYTLVGEIKRRAKQGEGGEFIARYSPSLSLSVGNYRDNSRILYREEGYLSVGGDKYIAVLKSRIPLLIIILLLVGFALLVMLKLPKGSDIIDPLPPVDSDVIPTPPDSETGTPDSGDNHVSMTYVLEAKTSLSSGEIGIYFSNPSKSTQDVVLELHVISGSEDVLLATSGRIPIGNSLVKMSADKKALSRLQEGRYEGYYRVICYDPETGERQLVEPKITDVNITVIE